MAPTFAQVKFARVQNFSKQQCFWTQVKTWTKDCSFLDHLHQPICSYHFEFSVILARFFPNSPGFQVAMSSTVQTEPQLNISLNLGCSLNVKGWLDFIFKLGSTTSQQVSQELSTDFAN